MHAEYPGWQIRDQLASNFRFTLLDHLRLVPFLHQAQVFAYMDRKELDPEPSYELYDFTQPEDGKSLRVWRDGHEFWLVARPVFTEVEFEKFGEATTELFPCYDEDDHPLIEHLYFRVRESERPRPNFIGASGAFKIAKSTMGGIIPASFGICPKLSWDFWGMEYDICVPEMEYLVSCLVDEAGGILPYCKEDTGNELVGWQRWKLDPDMGRMYLDLSNGARYRARSLRRTIESSSDPQKGKEKDGYSICEAYQFPNVQTLLEYRQNISVRKGYYVVPSTPDRPIMDEINRRCDPENEEFPSWLGIREIHRRENPYAFSAEEMFEDLRTFSREKFSVYWEGKSGQWMGSVYPEPQFFDTTTHPEMWHDPEAAPTLDNFAPPAWMKRRAGVDTGTLRGCASALCDDSGNIFFVGSFANYRYVAGKIEKDETNTIPSQCESIKSFHQHIGGKWSYFCDPNSQFKDDYRRLGGIVLRNGRRDPEMRCEVTRGMAQNGFIWFAPWLKESELVYEWRSAKYPDRGSSTRKEKRIDEDDHVLDCAEHVAAMHPRAERPEQAPAKDPVRAFLDSTRRRPNTYRGDPMTGA